MARKKHNQEQSETTDLQLDLIDAINGVTEQGGTVTFDEPIETEETPVVDTTEPETPDNNEGESNDPLDTPEGTDEVDQAEIGETNNSSVKEDVVVKETDNAGTQAGSNDPVPCTKLYNEEGKGDTNGQLVLLGRVTILRKSFGHKIEEVERVELFQLDNEFLIKNRVGSTLSTSFKSAEITMTVYIARKYPLESRAKGVTYTYTIE